MAKCFKYGVIVSQIALIGLSFSIQAKENNDFSSMQMKGVEQVSDRKSVV